MPENNSTFCKVWTKKTLQKFINQLSTSTNKSNTMQVLLFKPNGPDLAAARS